MQTSVYKTPPGRPSGKPVQPLSEKSDAISRRIRGTLIARGSSLRAWAHGWAERHGRDPVATYELARITIARRLERGLSPKGSLGRALIEDLRAELGAEVVPLPGGERPRLEAVA